MRIVIEHDTGPTPTAGASDTGARASAEPENAGAAPDAGAGGSATAYDGGAPPQWLMDAVSRATAADHTPTTTGMDAVDGGAGPDKLAPESARSPRPDTNE
jgi:hypothetical protein